MLKMTPAILAAAVLFAGPALAHDHGDKMKKRDGGGHHMKSMMYEDGEKLGREEFVARAGSNFEEADTAGNGQLSMEEFTAHMEAMKERRRSEMQERMFSRIDANGDGSISRDELEAHAGMMYDRKEEWKDRKKNGKDKRGE